MNWKEYLEAAERTMSMEFYCSKKEERLLHAVIGVLTEIEELLDNHIGESDETNRGEELGDVFWYLAIIGREFNIDYPQLIVKEKSNDIMGIVIKIIKNTCKLLDMLKKKIYYDKKIDEDLFKQISQFIMLDILDYGNYYGLNIEKSFEVNIAKLKARYGEKFSTERAINRDLISERNILEGKN